MSRDPSKREAIVVVLSAAHFNSLGNLPTDKRMGEYFDYADRLLNESERRRKVEDEVDRSAAPVGAGG